MFFTLRIYAGRRPLRLESLVVATIDGSSTRLAAQAVAPGVRVSSSGVVGRRVGDAFASVFVDDVEGAVSLELGDHTGMPSVQVAVVSSAEEDEVVHPRRSAVGHPLHVMAFGPGRWAIATGEAAVLVSEHEG